MTIDREKFLNDLQMVRSGLSNKELLEQSNCCIASTIIHTLGGDFTIRSLLEKGITEFDVYSTEGEELKIGRAHSLRKTREMVEVFQIIFDTGHTITLTEDHPVMLRDGTYRQVKDLKPGDSVMPFNHHFDGNYVWIYESVPGVDKKSTRRRAHSWVYEQTTRTEIGEGFHVHHKDENTFNNKPDNLERLTNVQHVRSHHTGKPRSEEYKAKMRVKMLGNKNGRFAKGIPKPANRGNKFACRPRANHKVISVEPAGREDVYDLSVEKYHNFAANGIFIHNCFVFRDGYVFTFNDEVACRKRTSMIIEGAVPAALLLAELEKLQVEKVITVEENSAGEIQFSTPNKRFAITRDAEVLLPIEKVTEETPKVWAKLPKDFGDIISKVKDCVSTDEANNWSLTCIHLHPQWIEACDNQQMIRWHVSLGNKTPLLVRGTAIAHVIGLGVTEVAATASWIHFKNAVGLIFSCRKFVEEYPPGMDSVLLVKGSPVNLPKGIMEASDRASIMSSEQAQGITPTVAVHIRPPGTGEKNGAVKIEGRGMAGWYEEIIPCNYKGPRIQFVMTPTLLQHITQNYNDCQITERKLKATGGAGEKSGLWEYVTVLGTPKKKAPPAPPSKKKPAAKDDTEDPQYREVHEGGSEEDPAF